MRRSRQHQHEHIGLWPEEALAAVVVRGGLKAQGAAYARTQGGRWWLGVMGLAPEVVAEKWERGA